MPNGCVVGVHSLAKRSQPSMPSDLQASGREAPTSTLCSSPASAGRRWQVGGDACPPSLGAGGHARAAAVGDKGTVGCDLPDVGCHGEEADEQALGGDAAHPAPGGALQGLVGGVLHEAVQAFNGVAVGGISPRPLVRAEGEILAKARPDVGGDGDRTLAAELRWCRRR